MNKLPLLLRHLHKQVTDEVESQRRMVALLERQEAAIAAARAPEVLEAGRAVEQELATASPRARRREVLLEGFANLWGLDSGTLTFSSVIERAGAAPELEAGPEAATLPALRDELRDLTAHVTRGARRVRTLAAAHQRLTMDILEVLFASDTERSVSDGGVLVNAEA